MILLEVVLCDVGASPEPAGVADPHVPLEAHHYGGVDGGHHGDLDYWEEVGQDHGVDVLVVFEPEVGQRVHHGAPSDHHKVGDGKDLTRQRN